MSVTSTQLEMAKKYLYNVEAAVAASDKTGLPLYILFAALSKESTWTLDPMPADNKGGRNIYGHDSGGVFNVYPQALEVTETNYRDFKRRIDAGERSNGVGPLQITYKGYFPIMEGRGLKPWVPADSILFGAEILKANLDRAKSKGYSDDDAIRWAGTWYNLGGSATAINDYGEDLLARSKTWKTRLDTTPPPPPPPPEPKVPIAEQRVTFEGKRTTVRSVRMLKEARYLFRLRGGGVYPPITQGGWSTSVGASAGTHARDAFDFGTAPFSRTRRLLWEWCMWEVGFASWRRSAIPGTWPAHDHALPKGGWLSAAAKDQIVQWNQGDNALRSDLDYPRILSSGFRTRTWESYLKNRPVGGTVDLSGLQTAFKTGGKSPAADNSGDNDVQQVQRALNHYLDSKLAVDGIAGPTTKGVYATYQARKYGVAKWSADANGIPGKASLQGLAFTVIA